MMAFSRKQLDSIAKKVCALLEANLFRQHNLDAKYLLPYLEDAAQYLVKSFEHINDLNHDFNGDLFASLRHGDVFANFLLRLSNSFREGGDLAAADDVAQLNKVLHGLDFFPKDQGIPDVLLLVHPLSTVVGGGATLPDRLVLYQNVTIGGVHNQEGGIDYPKFRGSAILNSGVSVLGNSEIYENVVFGANAFILNTNIPANSLVVGHYPNHRILESKPDLFDNYFR